MLRCDVGVAHDAFPYAGIVHKLAHNGLVLACGELELFRGGLVGLFSHLPVLVCEAIREREGAEVLFLVGHGELWRVVCSASASASASAGRVSAQALPESQLRL